MYASILISPKTVYEAFMILDTGHSWSYFNRIVSFLKVDFSQVSNFCLAII